MGREIACGRARTSSQVGQNRRVGRTEISFMYRRHLPHLLSGLPATTSHTLGGLQQSLSTLEMHATECIAADAVSEPYF